MIYNDLFPDDYEYDSYFDKQLNDITLNGDEEELGDLPPMPSLESDEKVKEGKGLKILTPSKVLTKLPILLSQIKLEIIQAN